MLFDEMVRECVILNKQITADGEGGHTAVWTEGRHFNAYITHDSHSVTRIAEAKGLKQQYTVGTYKGTVLPFNTVFKRLEDGAVFITTGELNTVTPAWSLLNVTRTTAERWELT